MKQNIKIYHNPRCGKSREGLQLLENSGKEFEVVEYLKNSLSKEELKEMGFKWSTSHKKWSFAGQKSGWTKKGMNYIRKKYGAKTVKNEADQDTGTQDNKQGGSIPNKAKLA